MQPIRVKNPKYNASGTISCLIWITEDQAEPWAVTADKNDPVPHSRELFSDLVDGKWGKVAPYTKTDAAKDRVMDNESIRWNYLAEANAIISKLRDERDADLLDDAGVAQFKEWVAYRKALNEIDVTVTAPAWPKHPGSTEADSK